MSKLTLLWVSWFVLLFGVLNIYGHGLHADRRPGDPPEMSLSSLLARQSKGDLLLFLLRNDDDTQRYFAYANAILGRPYQAYFVRPMAEWSEDETNGANGHQGIIKPQRPLAPWRDFSVEYPPGMLIFALVPALLTRDVDVYHFLFSLEMEALLTASALFAVATAERVRTGSGEAALAWTLASVAALGVVAVRRYDPCVSLAISGTLYGLAAGRPRLAGGALGLGIAAKGVPILLAPFGLIWFALRRDWRNLWRSLAVALLGLGLAGGVYLAIAGPRSIDTFAYHAERPVQFESVYGGLLLTARAFDPGVATTAHSYGSDNIVSAWEPLARRLATIVPLLAVGVIVVLAALGLRRADQDQHKLTVLLQAVCACIVAVITLGKVFSPQYMVWLIPLGALASVQAGSVSRKLMIASFLATQVEYPFVYSGLATSDPRFGVLILVRTLLLWGWIATLFHHPSTESQVIVETSLRPSPHLT